MIRLPRALAALVVIASALLVASTWRVFSPTWDEPAHVATGMEWWARGTFRMEPLTPPLARSLAAMGPWLAGARQHGRADLWDEGNAVLEDGAGYRRNIVYARAGLLPLFLLGAWAVWAWARRTGGEWAGVAAASLFATQPIVLGHAGLAATDLALTSGCALALERFTRWLEAPSARRAAWTGAACALATLAKFSAIPFLGGSFALIALLRVSLAGGAGAPRWGRAIARSAAPAALAAFLVLWAGYHFELSPLVEPHHPHAGIERRLGPLRGPVLAALEADAWPLRGFFKGLRAVPARNAISHKAYFEGEVFVGTRPAFFPVAFALRTPIPFLALLVAGGLFVLADRRARGRWGYWAPLIAALTVFAVAMAGKLDLGLRLALPAYAPLAVFAGLAAAAIAARGRAGLFAAIAAVLAQAAIAVAAWPDELAYFNAFAGRAPERHLVDSDLDWGQDLFRLADTLRARGVDTLAFAYSGSGDLAAAGIAHVRRLAPGERASGWVAANVYALRLGRPKAPPDSAGAYRWIEATPPVARVGRSIRLYRVPPARPR